MLWARRPDHPGQNIVRTYHRCSSNLLHVLVLCLQQTEHAASSLFLFRTKTAANNYETVERWLPLFLSLILCNTCIHSSLVLIMHNISALLVAIHHLHNLPGTSDWLSLINAECFQLLTLSINFTSYIIVFHRNTRISLIST